MANPFQLSEASTIAIHSMILIANSGSPVNANQIAERSGTSRHHVSKVLQQLSKNGLIRSYRGPAGGFLLNEKPEKISLLEVFESIEGKIRDPECPLEDKICPYDKCFLNGIISRMTKDFRKYLANELLDKYIIKKEDRK